MIKSTFSHLILVIKNQGMRFCHTLHLHLLCSLYNCFFVFLGKKLSTIGTQKNAECFAAFMRGYNAMIERLTPAKILCFTSTNRGIIDLSGNVEFIQTTTFKNKPRAVN